ncbi:hypothetical protein J3F83DRAFT_366651 [Trichoderma novae-zelandiae]
MLLSQTDDVLLAAEYTTPPGIVLGPWKCCYSWMPRLFASPPDPCWSFISSCFISTHTLPISIPLTVCSLNLLFLITICKIPVEAHVHDIVLQVRISDSGLVNEEKPTCAIDPWLGKQSHHPSLPSSTLSSPWWLPLTGCSSRRPLQFLFRIGAASELMLSLSTPLVSATSQLEASSFAGLILRQVHHTAPCPSSCRSRIRLIPVISA